MWGHRPGRSGCWGLSRPLWIISPAFRPIYSPHGLIAALGWIVQTWMNTEHQTFLVLSLHIQSGFVAAFFPCPLTHSAQGCFQLSFLPHSALEFFFFKRGRARLADHFRDQRHEVIQEGLWDFFVLHLKTSHSSMWESKTNGPESAGETLEWIIVLTGEEELFCVYRGQHGIKMFCCGVLLKDLLPASSAKARMWVMRTPVGMFLAGLRDKCNVKRNNL